MDGRDGRGETLQLEWNILHRDRAELTMMVVGWHQGMGSYLIMIRQTRMRTLDVSPWLYFGALQKSLVYRQRGTRDIYPRLQREAVNNEICFDRTISMWGIQLVFYWLKLPSFIFIPARLNNKIYSVDKSTQMLQFQFQNIIYHI